MKNFVQEGKTITFANSTSEIMASGDLVTVGAFTGVVAADVAPAADGELTIEGVFTLPKTSADDVSFGELLYNDGGTLTVDGSGAKPLAGAATAAAAPGAVTVACKLGVHGITG